MNQFDNYSYCFAGLFFQIVSGKHNLREYLGYLPRLRILLIEHSYYCFACNFIAMQLHLLNLDVEVFRTIAKEGDIINLHSDHENSPSGQDD